MRSYVSLVWGHDIWADDSDIALLVNVKDLGRAR
jgi:hypothetical protein